MNIISALAGALIAFILAHLRHHHLVAAKEKELAESHHAERMEEMTNFAQHSEDMASKAWNDLSELREQVTSHLASAKTSDAHRANTHASVSDYHATMVAEWSKIKEEHKLIQDARSPHKSFKSL